MLFQTHFSLITTLVNENFLTSLFTVAEEEVPVLPILHTCSEGKSDEVERHFVVQHHWLNAGLALGYQVGCRNGGFRLSQNQYQRRVQWIGMRAIHHRLAGTFTKIHLRVLT